MASASLSFSSQFFAGQKFAVSPKTSPATSVRFLKSPPVTAAYATAERTRSHITSSPASLYDVLGIQIGATCPEIKAAYRRLARVSHPDVASNGRNESSADEFMRIHAAYSTLSDPEKRADYDRTLFWLHRPKSSPFTMYGVSSTGMTSSGSRFSGKTRRSWETDQCW